MKKVVDKISEWLFISAIGVSPLLLFGLTAVCLYNSFSIAQEYFYLWLTAGLSVGLVADVVLFVHYGCVYKIPYALLAVAYVLFNIGVFGFFMGFPVFNLLCGMIAGMYAARRLSYDGCGIQTVNKSVGRIACACAFMMFLLCISSAVIALSDSYIRGNVKGMLGMKTEPSMEFIYGLIVVGGITLVAVQYFSVIFCARLQHK